MKPLAKNQTRKSISVKSIDNRLLNMAAALQTIIKFIVAIKQAGFDINNSFRKSYLSYLSNRPVKFGNIIISAIMETAVSASQHFGKNSR